MEAKLNIWARRLLTAVTVLPALLFMVMGSRLAKEVRKQLNRIERLLKKMAKATKLYAHVQADVLKLKYYHQRYSNYLRWLQWQEPS